MKFWVLGFLFSFNLFAASRLPLVDKDGMVATDNALASRIGADVLKRGGNAFDAAVACGFALGVLHPHSSGIGGGMVGMIYHSQTRTLKALDAREFAPLALREDDFRPQGGKPDRNLSTRGGLSSGVPLEIRGLELIHSQFGRLPWAGLLKPAIQLAREGFEIDTYLAKVIASQKELLQKSPYLRTVYAPGGKWLQEGDFLRQPVLAETLESIASEGADAFYLGEIAESLVGSIRAHQGKMVRQDLALARARLLDPIVTPFRGHEIVSMPPPSSGGLVLAQITRVLEPFPLKDMGHNSSAYLHVLAEAMKHAYADRSSELGDERFVSVDRSRFLSEDSVSRIRSMIQETVLPHHTYGTRTLPDDAGTTHFSIADNEGNLVALTSSINTAFGSGLADSGTGILLNNHMDDFSLAPDIPNAYGLLGSRTNAIRPLKKPLSSMSPTLVLKDKKVRMALGGSGGPRIISGTLQVLLNVLVFDMGLQEAVDSPRAHHQWSPDVLRLEKGIPVDVSDALRARGHHVEMGIPRNVIQAVEILDTGIAGASDPRKMGLPAGVNRRIP